MVELDENPKYFATARTYLAILVLSCLSDTERLDGLLKFVSVGDKGLQVDQTSGYQGDGHRVVSRSISASGTRGKLHAHRVSWKLNFETSESSE
jgi:hypothetical protein